MPIHDWTRVTAGTFHAFHVAWVAEIQRTLNAGVLPDGYYALAEQVAGRMILDVLTLREPSDGEPGLPGTSDSPRGGTAIALAPPQTALTETIAVARAVKAPQRRVAVRHASDDRVVALLEIVSPCNKDGRAAVEQFVDKAAIALGEGLHLLIVDLFPPGSFDPDGLHGLLWPRLGGEAYHPSADKPLTLASYNAGAAEGLTCYLEPTHVGADLIPMPLVLSPTHYISVPLEQTYASAYTAIPRRWKDVIES